MVFLDGDQGPKDSPEGHCCVRIMHFRSYLDHRDAGLFSDPLLNFLCTSCSHQPEERTPNSTNAHWVTHVHDQEVQPAPGIGEVILKAVGHPFEQHLKHKDKREHPVSVLQQGLHRGLPVKVKIFKGLEGRKQVDRWPRPTAVGPKERKGPSQPWPQPLGELWEAAHLQHFVFSALGR